MKIIRIVIGEVGATVQVSEGDMGAATKHYAYESLPKALKIVRDIIKEEVETKKKPRKAKVKK